MENITLTGSEQQLSAKENMMTLIGSYTSPYVRKISILTEKVGHGRLHDCQQPISEQSALRADNMILAVPLSPYH